MGIALVILFSLGVAFTILNRVTNVTRLQTWAGAAYEVAQALNALAFFVLFVIMAAMGRLF